MKCICNLFKSVIAFMFSVVVVDSKESEPTRMVEDVQLVRADTKPHEVLKAADPVSLLDLTLLLLSL